MVIHIGFGLANATRGPRIRTSESYYFLRMYFFVIFTRRRTLHRLVFIPLHFSLRARSRVPSFIVLCSVTSVTSLFSRVRRRGAFISFYIYSEDSLVFPQSFGTPKTELSYLDSNIL